MYYFIVSFVFVYMNLFFAQVIDSLETKEIVSLVLKKLPDPVTVDLSAFEVINGELSLLSHT